VTDLQYVMSVLTDNLCMTEGSWICIVPHCEKLASEALRHGSHSF